MTTTAEIMRVLYTLQGPLFMALISLVVVGLIYHVNRKQAEYWGKEWHRRNRRP